MRCPMCRTVEMHVDLVRKAAWCPGCKATVTKMDLLRMSPSERMELNRPIATSQQPNAAESDTPTIVEG